MEKTKCAKRLIVLELNEFNLQLMQELAETHNMQNLKKILSFNVGITLTEDEYDSGYLEPWVQWVSVHTGFPASVHKIKHLGDVPNLSFKQIWEKLSDNGHSSIVWGAMNASRGRAELCKYFLPDPWTFSEPGFPDQAAKLLELPRYLAKNYLDIKLSHVISKLTRFLKVFDFSIFFSKVGVAELGRLLKALIRYGPKNFIAISYFDFISVQMFLNVRKNLSPDVSFLFLNSIAHIQHHYWSKASEEKLIYGYKVIDRALGLLFNSITSNDELLILNALSQTNTNHERPWVLYRQKDPGKFFAKLNLNILSVEQLMTNDTQLFFNSTEDRDSAYAALCAANINGQPLFHCELNSKNLNCLFVRLDFFEELSGNPDVTVKDQIFKFFEDFETIVIRTGKHIPRGTLLTQKVPPPPKIKNHEVYDFICKLAEQNH